MNTGTARNLVNVVRTATTPRSAAGADRFATGTVATLVPLTLYLDGNTTTKVPAMSLYKTISVALTAGQVVDVFVHNGVPRILGGY